MLIGGCVLGASTALIGSAVWSQDSGQPDMQQMMDQWMALMTPAEHHKLMEGSIGKWETETKMWWGGPGSEPMVTKGRAERTWILGGRFVQERMFSEMQMPDMATGAMNTVPWEGMGIFGFDNYRKLYVGCWVDTMGTQMITMKGTVDPSGKVFTYYGEMDEPALGVIGRTVKYETRVMDDDHAVFSIYDLHAGADYKVVEVAYARQKDASPARPAGGGTRPSTGRTGGGG